MASRSIQGRPFASEEQEGLTTVLYGAYLPKSTRSDRVTMYLFRRSKLYRGLPRDKREVAWVAPSPEACSMNSALFGGLSALSAG